MINERQQQYFNQLNDWAKQTKKVAFINLPEENLISIEWSAEENFHINHFMLKIDILKRTS